MQFKNAWHILEEDIKFIEWKKEHLEAVFSYAFTTVDKELGDDWQIGFYDKAVDKITTFSIMGGKVVDSRQDDIFKKPDAKVLEVDFDKIKLTVGEVLEKVNSFVKEKYPQEIVTKKILILQNLPKVGTVWNITHITMNMNSLNVKIDASTGEVKEYKLVSLMEFRNKVPTGAELRGIN